VGAEPVDEVADTGATDLPDSVWRELSSKIGARLGDDDLSPAAMDALDSALAADAHTGVRSWRTKETKKEQLGLTRGG
jgi:hypothetical protein